MCGVRSWPTLEELSRTLALKYSASAAVRPTLSAPSGSSAAVSGTALCTGSPSAPSLTAAGGAAASDGVRAEVIAASLRLQTAECSMGPGVGVARADSLTTNSL